MKNRMKLFVLSVLFLFSWGLAQAGSFAEFFRAIDIDDVGAVQSLLANGFDPNAVNAKGNSALYMALRDKSLKVAKLLIEQPKIKLDQLNPSDENALMIASLLGDRQLVQEMVERGAEINKPGWTPLAYAATNGHTQIVQYLLDHSAYIDAPAPNGTTPLMLAAYFGHDATVKLLLDEGADASLKNQLGYTALKLAKQRGHQGAANLIASFQPKAPLQGHW